MSTFATSELDISPPSNAQLPKQDLMKGLNQHNFAVLSYTHIKSEDETSTIVETDLPAVRSMPSTSIAPQEQGTEVAICPNRAGIPIEIHIKTENESTGGFVGTEIKTVHLMPVTEEAQE